MAKTALRRGSQDEGNSEYFTGCPIGGGFMWFGLITKIPTNCRVCDNSTLAIASFAKLNENLGGAWGTSGGNLNIPDLRGKFPRGVDDGAANDPDAAGRTANATGGNTGDAVGSVQGSKTENHSHDLSGGFGMTFHQGSGDYATRQISTAAWTPNLAQGGDSVGAVGSASSGTQLGGNTGVVVTSSTGESRPKNANVYFVIRVS